MKYRTATLALAGALLAFPLTAAQADDRKPTNDELAQIHKALLGAGFSTWGEIERDDDDDDSEVWEIDDAVTAKGERYDLTLDENYEIVERDRED
ncbi:MAG: PepSY domain-containing protein [Rhodovibrionaceae bacterium]